ncbi:MAG: helix-turn-helix transcriptional regulator [Coriobacteriales bacterium]|jgi:DNA-binding CsgD family transcriptional regulator|nr:helix-turn-helix transcriptional regulator [Coriobacteriales bacterium]
MSDNPADEASLRSTYRDWLLVAARSLRPHLILGLGLHWVWLYALLYSGFSSLLITNPVIELADYPLGGVCALSFIGMTLCMGLFAEKITYIIRRQKLQISIAVILSVSTACLFLSDRFLTMPLIVFSEVFSGAAAAFLMLIWSEAFRRREPLAILLNTILSIIVGLIAFRFVVFLLEPMMSALVFSIIPLFEMTFLFFALHGVRAMMHPQQFTTTADGAKLAAPGLYEVPTFHKLRVSRHKFLMRMSIPFLLFGMAFGLLCHQVFTVPTGQELDVGTLFMTTLLPCVISLVVVLVFVAMNRYTEYEPYYRYIIPILGVLILSTTIQGVGASNSIFTFATYICFEFFMWVEFCVISHRYRISPILVTGVGRAFVVIGMFLIQNLMSATPITARIAFSDDMLHTFIVVALIVGYSLLPREGDIRAMSILEKEVADTGQQEPATGDYRLKRFFARCGRIANQYLLSSRETEVFYLLAKGRNAAYIAKNLYISEGTVHTHTWRIYKKLDVHSQQELIDMVDAPPSSEEPPAPEAAPKRKAGGG